MAQLSSKRLIDEYLLNRISQPVLASLRWAVERWDLLLAAAMCSIAGSYVLYLLLITHSGFWDFKGMSPQLGQWK